MVEQVGLEPTTLGVRGIAPTTPLSSRLSYCSIYLFSRYVAWFRICTLSGAFCPCSWLAEETGIEPVHTGVKALGLSAWLFLRVSGIKIARAVSRSGYVY